MDEKQNDNALKDDPDWCGHAFVSRKAWACADCDRPVTPATRQRLEHADPVAPDGYLWVLMSANQDDTDHPTDQAHLEGLFTNRDHIARLLIRGWIVSAAEIRKRMKRTHWYQGAYNEKLFEGWEEDVTERDPMFYYLYLEKIDRSG